MQKRRKILLISLLSLIIIVFLIFLGVYLSNLYERQFIPSHKIVKSDGLELKWQLQKVSSNAMDGGPFITASKGELFVNGRIGSDGNSYVYRLDESSGAILSKVLAPVGSFYMVDDTTFYLVKPYLLGCCVVQKYDRKTMKLTWESRLINERVPHCLQVVNNELQIAISFEKFFRLSIENGAILEERSNSKTLCRFENGVDYIYNRSEIIAEMNQGILWKTGNIGCDFGGSFISFGQKVVYFKACNGLHTVDRNTGKVIWQLKSAISNVAVSNDRIYVATEDGHLYGLDPSTTNIQTDILFDTSNLNNDPSGGLAIYRPEVAYDSSTGMVYLLISNSGQLFAFKETK